MTIEATPAAQPGISRRASTSLIPSLSRVAAALARSLIGSVATSSSALEPAAARIRQELRKYGISFDGTVEQRFEWDEVTEEGKSIACSAVLDHFKDAQIHDLKTGSEPVSLREAARLIANSHSVLQDAAYKSALSEETGVPVGDYEFVYVFVQTREPFSVTPVTLSGEFQQVSHLKWRRAIEMWHKCLSAGEGRENWPGPVEAIVPVPAPGWMLSQEIELEELRG